MLDIKLIRKDPLSIEKRLKTKDPHISLAPFLSLDEEVRKHKSEGEELKNRRNLLSKEIGEKKRSGENTSRLMEEVGQLNVKISHLDKELARLEQSLHDLLARLPNLPHPESKISQEVKDNVVLREHGKKPSFPFTPKHHVELNESLHLFDFTRAAKVAGSHWPAYRGMGARLEWALINYMVDYHLKNNYLFWLPPLLARTEVAYGSAQLPKFEQQLFKITDEDYQLYLIPTSEMALMGLHREEILDPTSLPLKYVSYSPCFRREAGALGAQERGLIRMHQFNKVEMFGFTTPEQSDAMFEEMVTHGETLISSLGLHFRTTELVTGDMSFAAAKTIDLEVWLPGQGRYYEVSSISNCSDFQARRSQTRFRTKEGTLEFCHTLNGSGLATSRLMVALLENFQQADGSILIPSVLQPYLGGITVIC